MLASLLLCVAIVQAEPVSASSMERFQSSSTIIDLKGYHPTVEYVPHMSERRQRAPAPQSSLTVRTTAPYELVVHSTINRSKEKTTAMPVYAPSSTSRSAAPKLHASFQIPVPDDLTIIQQKGVRSARSEEAVITPRKTTTPRIERILGIDSAHLPVTNPSSSSLHHKVVPHENNEIPVPTIGS